MKGSLSPLLAFCLGLVAAATINEDILRDRAMYDSGARSKRAVCGGNSITTRRPVTWNPTIPRRTVTPVWPWYTTPPPFKCLNCDMSICYLTSKKRAIMWNQCPSSCCPNRFNPLLGGLSGSVAGASNSLMSDSSLKSMASSLVDKIGKRADDSQFKKPSMDLVFLIDDSGSIAPQQFKVAQEGAATLSQAICPRKMGTEKGTKQVSVVLFSTTPKTVLTFQQSREGAAYTEDAIMNMQQRSGATATTDAIKHIREKVLGQSGSRLNDPDTATVIFVITDGKCNDGCQSLKTEAKKLRETGPGVQVFAFGIGEADCQELEDIRGPDSGEVFGLPDYNFFEKLANAIKDEMANNPVACMG